MSTPIHDSLYYLPLNAYLGMPQTYFDTWCIVLWKIMMLSVNIWEYIARALHFQNACREKFQKSYN